MKYIALREIRVSCTGTTTEVSFAFLYNLMACLLKEKFYILIIAKSS